MLGVKSAAPSTPVRTCYHSITFPENPVTLFTSPPGYQVSDSLASVLVLDQLPAIWLRAGIEDCDPGILFDSIAEAANNLLPGFRDLARRFTHQVPGNSREWQPAFIQLAHQLAKDMPGNSVLVLDHAHHLNAAPDTLKLLTHYFLTELAPAMRSVLISHDSLSQLSFPFTVGLRGSDFVQLGPDESLSLTKDRGVSLPQSSFKQVMALSAGQSSILDAILSAYQYLGPEAIKKILARSLDIDSLLEDLARACLSQKNDDRRLLMAFTALLGYNHPHITRAAFDLDLNLEDPWLQPLETGWVRVRCIWHAPLERAVHQDLVKIRPAVSRAADFLARQGETSEAVRLFIAAHQPEKAVEVIAASSEKMMDLGQWQTLAGWIERLPQAVVNQWSNLLYAQGEISALTGNYSKARQIFSSAAASFSSRNDPEGVCRSLLAESALAAETRNLERAEFAALAANTIATESGLTWYAGLTSWQLGRLAVLSGKLDQALAYFSKARSAIQETPLSTFIQSAEDIARKERELQRRSKQYQQASLAAMKAQQQALEQLLAILDFSPDSFTDLIDMLGWSRTPFMFKLPGHGDAADLADSGPSGFWGRVWSFLQSASRKQAQDPLLPADFSALDLPLTSFPILPGQAATSTEPGEPALPELPSFEHSPNSSQAQPGPSPDNERAEVILNVFMLGSFHLTVNTQPVSSWSSMYGLAILKYLLVNRDQKVPREVLMDTFWKETNPASARNNLNVALHKLRVTFREFTPLPIIVFDWGSYSINPSVRIVLDVKEFEEHFQAGRRLEQGESESAAVPEYEKAVALYQGDFLEDDPYEEWSVLTRERLRISYLDALNRLSNIYFNLEQYETCANLALRILDCDKCREDAHALLMRCYSRQGQPQLALRQYQICVGALKTELDIDPEPSTTHLAEKIRRHERI
jgi:DNA-binding SARP family transcriptional activator